MQSILSVLSELTVGSATRALNKRAQRVSQSRSRTDSVVAIPQHRVHSSLCANDWHTDTHTAAPPSSPSSHTDTQSESETESERDCGAEDEEAVLRLFHETYALEDLLGKGASATVYRVRHRLSGQRFACKIISRDEKMNDLASMRTEVLVMKKLSHTHIVQLLELYETRDRIYMVLELAEGGAMVSALAALPVYSEAVIARVFKQLLLAVQYLHSKGVVHRDLKMDNLLCATPLPLSHTQSHTQSQTQTHNGSHENTESLEIIAKIADFGLSAVTLKRDEAATERDLSLLKRLSTLREAWGTAEYLAPEVLQRAYGFQADIWSLGCLLCEMLTGELAFPFREHTVSLVDRVVHYGGAKPLRSFERTPAWRALSPAAQSLVKGMLKVDPRRRLDIDECLRHPFIAREEVPRREELVLAHRAMADRAQRKAKRFEIIARDIAPPEIVTSSPSRSSSLLTPTPAH